MSFMPRSDVSGKRFEQLLDQAAVSERTHTISLLSRPQNLTLEDLVPLHGAMKRFIDDEEVAHLLLAHFVELVDSLDSSFGHSIDMCRTLVQLFKKQFVSLNRNLLIAIRRLAGTGNAALLFDCISLMPFVVRSTDEEIQILACDCVSSLCTSSIAVQSFLCANGLLSIASIILTTQSETVCHALHTLHTLSSDLNCAREICQIGLIPVLVSMLEEARFVCSVAGILQNIGREKSCWPVLISSGVVEHIVHLLQISSPFIQARAVGVLMNMHQGNAESRDTLRSILSLQISSTVYIS